MTTESQKELWKGVLEEKRLVGNQKNRAWKDAAKLFRTKNWCAAARHSTRAG